MEPTKVSDGSPAAQAAKEKQSDKQKPETEQHATKGKVGQTANKELIPKKEEDPKKTAEKKQKAADKAGHEAVRKKLAEEKKAQQAEKKAHDQLQKELAICMQRLVVSVPEEIQKQVAEQFQRGVKVPGRAVAVPETTSLGLTELLVNLSCNIHNIDCNSCVSDERDPQYKLAMRLHLLGYDIWLEEALDNDFQIGDKVGSGAGKRVDLYVAKGQAQAIVEVKKTKTWDLAQVQKYMELLNLHKKVNFGMIISFPGRDPPRWGRLRFHEGQYNPFDLARSDEVVLKHAELLKAHYKAYPAVKP